MIKLNIGIGEGDVDILTFENKDDLQSFIGSLDFVDSVWLVSCNCDPMPCVFVHEDVLYINTFVEHVLLGSTPDEECSDIEMELHLHQYDSYEDAFKVATDFFEENPLCYNLS